MTGIPTDEEFDSFAADPYATMATEVIEVIEDSDAELYVALLRYGLTEDHALHLLAQADHLLNGDTP